MAMLQAISITGTVVRAESALMATRSIPVEMEAQRVRTALEGPAAARAPVLAAMDNQEPCQLITEEQMVDMDQEVNGVAVEAIPPATPS